MPRPAAIPGPLFLLLRRGLPLAFPLLAAALALAQAASGLGYTTSVGPALIAQYAQRFREPARDFLGRWIAFGRDQKGASPMAQRLQAARGRESEVLQVVNDYFNRNVRYLEDPVHWNQIDYWATPAESVASNGGDCEDFAIAKYYMLKELGVPLERLRITYVKALRINQAHMVLAYYARPDAEPLILDNLENQIRPASERPDLVPVYSFNDDEVQLAQDGRRAKPSQIRNWTNLQDRLLAEART